LTFNRYTVFGREKNSVGRVKVSQLEVVSTKTYECYQRKDRQTNAKDKYSAEINMKAVISKTDHCNLYHTLLH
jgi:hypothetical protein